jgi:putative flavoprotein involved in K+ transport
MSPVLGSVVIGAGHAGLAASQALRQAGVEHVVLERGRIGETWLSQRWESFALNTPGWSNVMPGDSEAHVVGHRDGFAGHREFAAGLAGYADRHGLPVRTGATVTGVEPPRAGGPFIVRVAGEAAGPLETRTVVVASGMLNVPRRPAVAAALPADIVQLHTGDYRSPADLAPGGVLVAGSGQSGVQIAEDLVLAGRTVFLSPSRAARLRRRHRGRDVFEWLIEAGWFRMTVDQLEDPAMQFVPQPLISGVGRYGHSVSLQWLAGLGIELVGRIVAVDGHKLVLADTVAECIRHGDERSAEMSRQLDQAIAARGLPMPPVEDDPGDIPHPDPSSVHSPPELDLRAAGVSTILWSTGFTGAFDFLAPELKGADGLPLIDARRGPVDGLHYIGFPWLTSRGSGVIPGAAVDAVPIAKAVIRRLDP